MLNVWRQGGGHVTSELGMECEAGNGVWLGQEVLPGAESGEAA